MTEQPEKPEKYFIRFSSARDQQKILEFYDLNAHKSVRKRETELMTQLIADGAVVLIEDEGGKIVGSSITYPHKVKDKDGVEHVKWQEIGSTRIALNGYPGLFDSMVTMQVLRTFLVEPPDERFVSQMHTSAVQGLAAKLGWRSYTAPAELMALKQKTVAPGDAALVNVGVNWFHCGIESLPVMARQMVHTIDNPVIENKKTGKKIEIDYSRSTFAKIFLPEIKALSTRDIGNVDQPDIHRSVSQSHKIWLKSFFR